MGKMVYSAGVTQLAMVAYVPEEFKDKVPIQEWCDHVCAATGGKMTCAPRPAESPDGGLVAEMVGVADPEKGKFPIKDKDLAMAAAFAFLRTKGAFPDEKDDDDDDDVCFGDDAFDNIDEM